MVEFLKASVIPKILEYKASPMIAKDYTPTFTVNLMLKDLRIIAAMADGLANADSAGDDGAAGLYGRGRFGARERGPKRHTGVFRKRRRDGLTRMEREAFAKPRHTRKRAPAHMAVKSIFRDNGSILGFSWKACYS